ncbi:helix-turn-helix transcriptional regulator [Halorarius litoreus]|uniref:helix-turn-helix transcriptional regulator n=1 Tax=Halorarius litoreus TaxID=2962676 RepID=UPI0020CFD762|nr:hypothetical protein [Halorarius litoreus]
MDDALDDIRFLADSEHRAVVMSALADGPRSRADLRDVTGASSATVGRMLQAFEERGWLVRNGHEYALTALGSFVARSFDGLHRDMAAARDLHELLPGVPLDDIGIGVEQLADARVTRATHENPFAVVSRVREIELTTDAGLSLTDFFPEPCIDGRYEAVVEGDQTFEAVFAPVVIEKAMASDAAEKFAAIVAADRSDVYVYEGPIEHPVMFHDGLACLIVRNDQNITEGLIETTDETVVEWVKDVFERHRATARRLAPEELATGEGEVVA